MIKVAPSILAANLEHLADEIKAVERAGADWLHIDIMDGHFVPPITFGDNVVAAAKRCSKLFLDVHLMISDPERQVDAFKSAGANRLTIHQEIGSKARSTLEKIKSSGLSAGISVRPETPVQAVGDFLEICDLVLIMTVNPGWGGQKFMPETLPKISWVRNEAAKRNLKIHVEVDGGINAETGAECVKAGADVLVAGTYIFKSADPAAAIKALKH